MVFVKKTAGAVKRGKQEGGNRQLELQRPNNNDAVEHQGSGKIPDL